MITLTFCGLFPLALASRVTGLVLTHTTPTNPVRTQRFRASSDQTQLIRRYGDLGADRFFTRFQPEASPAVMARGMLGMMRTMRLKLSKASPFPTLVVAGDRDSVTKPEASERIRSGIPRAARLIILAPAKHLGLIEHHTRYAEVVHEFAYAAEAQMGDVA